MRLLMKNAWVLTMDEDFTEHHHGWVLAEDGRIAALGEGTLPEAEEVIDCGGALLLPGFVNTHAHASMVPFRSMGDDCPDRLRRFLFPLENEALTPELTGLGARYGIAEMLLSGITSFVDMYYFEEQVAEAAEKMGIRAWVGETVISQRAPDAATPADSLRRAEALMARYAGHPMIHALIAPHGTTTVEADVLRACQALAERYHTLVTIHVSEQDYEMAHFAEQGTTPVAWLDSLGLCTPALLAAHCIHLSGEDLALMRDRGVRVAHCVGSNMKAGKGIAPAKRFAELGIPYGLGTDGPSSGNTLSMFDQLRLFAVAHKTANHDRTLFPAREIVAAATRGGAAALHAPEIGMLKAGMQADMITVSTESPRMFPLYNPYAALVYAANAADVRDVVIAGRPVMRDGRLLTADLSALREELAGQMGAFMRAAEKYADMI